MKRVTLDGPVVNVGSPSLEVGTTVGIGVGVEVGGIAVGVGLGVGVGLASIVA